MAASANLHWVTEGHIITPWYRGRNVGSTSVDRC